MALVYHTAPKGLETQRLCCCWLGDIAAMSSCRAAGWGSRDGPGSRGSCHIPPLAAARDGMGWGWAA